MTTTKEDVATYFRFLDALRESGAINMFGCFPYLIETFALERGEARAIAGEWMRTFDRESSVEARAAAANL